MKVAARGKVRRRRVTCVVYFVWTRLAWKFLNFMVTHSHRWCVALSKRFLHLRECIEHEQNCYRQMLLAKQQQQLLLQERDKDESPSLHPAVSEYAAAVARAVQPIFLQVNVWCCILPHSPVCMLVSTGRLG